MKMKFSYLKSILIVSFLLSISIKHTQAQLSFERKDWGPVFITSPSFLNGIHKVSYDGDKTTPNKIPVVGLSQFVGYQFSHYFMMGLGVEFDYWTKPRNAFVPIYLDLRFTMLTHDFAPHWYLNIGYGSHWSIDSKAISAHGINSNAYVLHGAKSGIMAETGLGVKANASYSNAIIITFTAKVQESAIKYCEPEIMEISPQEKYIANKYQNNWYLFLGVKAGIVF